MSILILLLVLKYNAAALLFEMLYFEFQRHYDLWQKLKESNIKSVIVEEMQSKLYSSETSLQWGQLLIRGFPYIRLSKTVGLHSLTLSRASTTFIPGIVINSP